MKSAYIHIPFCDSICSYCDFAKVYKNKDWIKKYLVELEKEIRNNYKNEILDTIYIGGGTPSSLEIEDLKALFNIIKIFKLSKNIEFTFECNIENIDYEKLKFLYEKGVNRLSIGVQTFNNRLLKYLNRNHNKDMVFNKISMMKDIGFKNINIDLIYAIPKETINDVKTDIEEFLKLDINHISTYSLIIESNTNLYIKSETNIDEESDYDMYKYICKTLKNNGYKHYEISNFSKDGYESRHNLTYWNNLEYYGFGMGASGYINGIRYDNTRSLTKYLKGKYLDCSNKVSKEEQIENELILGFRKIDGIKKQDFYNKYGIDIKNVNNINKLLKEKKLLENDKYIYINPKYIYTSNNILINFIK